ncbi:uncharacterized protein LOC112564627 [Pomacea canaliculata]|uniref:uncharacterized protein LOC112564627 n=1 Tax=Pomacea canaliculata TaxID=400727 RepID=UPI000D73F855|nr:uncharacterized protein LOC112564627 [Pomacea canaliculata]
MAQGGKNVTLRAVNTLVHPNFEIQANLPDTHSRFLIEMVQEAAGIDPGFNRFAVHYHTSPGGYYLSAINDVYAEKDKTYWCILDFNNRPVEYGMSTYEPRDGETVTFELRVDAGGQHPVEGLSSHTAHHCRLRSSPLSFPCCLVC